MEANGKDILEKKVQKYESQETQKNDLDELVKKHKLKMEEIETSASKLLEEKAELDNEKQELDNKFWEF